MAQTIQSVYNYNVLKLNEIYSVDESRAITDRLFEHYFNLTPVQRVLTGSLTLADDKFHAITEATKSLLKHIPLQYVTGKAYFGDMEFAVNSSVLIPRPETEQLVDLICSDLATRNDHPYLRILDIGTGSGCIAITLKNKLPQATVSAIDISEEALKIARSNAEKYKADVEFIKSDILTETQWEILTQYDLIVSNPPYVTLSEKQMMKSNVLDYEPHIALFVPDEDPLVFYRSILLFAKSKLSHSGCLWFEINEMFAAEMKDLAISQGFKKTNIIFDFHGKSRFLQCSRI